MASEDVVTVLLAKQAVRDALSRYCRAMDRRDEKLAASLWHGDGTADYGDAFRGTGAGFAAWVTETHLLFARHSHQITNVLTRVGAGGHDAVSEAYVTVALWTAPDAEGAVTQITSRGRYLDRWTLRDGRWAVAARQYVDDFTATQRLSVDEAAPLSAESCRDQSDPSYAWLASLE